MGFIKSIKDKAGKVKGSKYVKAAVLEALNFNWRKGEVRLYSYMDEEARKEDWSKPETQEVVHSVEFSKKEIDAIQKIVYGAVKRHKERIDDEIIPEKKDSKGKVIQKASRKEQYITPFGDVEDVM